MAGLFDMLDDPNTMGLLSAGSAMMNASGPSLMPRSFGQVLSAGFGGLQDARKQQLAQAQAAQLSKLNGLKIQDAESDLKKQEAQRQRDEALRQFYIQRAQGTATPMPAGQPAAQVFGQQMAAGPDAAPVQPAPAAPSAGGQNMGIYHQRLKLADDLRNAGYAQEADAQEAAALKFQPKVKDWKAVTVNGKEMYAPYFEDGTPGQPVPLEVARELHFQSVGGKTLGLHPVTGAQMTSYDNTITPGEAASNQIARDRLNFDKGQGKVPSGYRLAADGKSLEAIPGGPAADKVTNPQQKAADARDVLALLDQAEPLVKKATGSYGGAGMDQAARMFGVSTDGAQSAAQLKALEGMLVSKMPKMSGPQSDKDVLLYKQMAGQIGDTTIPKATKLAAMQTIREINERYANAAPAPAGAPARKVATLADIAATAKSSGRSTAEVTAALRAQGYTIGGN